MRLIIKNMVSNRCIVAAKLVFQNLGIYYLEIKLGEVELDSAPSPLQYKQLQKELSKIGLELMEDNNKVLIEKIKKSILELIHYSKEPINKKYSCFLSEKLNYNYTYLSNVFKKCKGMCIEDYIIAHKIERAKQLLVYSELNLTQISYELNYSSVGHLSNQFKKITGLTARDFKQSQNKTFIPLELL